MIGAPGGSDNASRIISTEARGDSSKPLTSSGSLLVQTSSPMRSNGGACHSHSDTATGADFCRGVREGLASSGQQSSWHETRHQHQRRARRGNPSPRQVSQSLFQGATAGDRQCRQWIEPTHSRTDRCPGSPRSTATGQVGAERILSSTFAVSRLRAELARDLLLGQSE